MAVNATFGALADAIAHLVANDYIQSGRQQPNFIGRLRGESEISFFWATTRGLQFLDGLESAPPKSDAGGLTSTTEDLEVVDKVMRHLGYDMTQYGVGAALLSLESGYSHSETAMNLALVSFARDCKAAGTDILRLAALAAHASAMMKILAEYRDAGVLRDDLFKNDMRALMKVAVVDQDQSTWIERVLSDPVAAGDIVATSRINYDRA
ncbi:MAG: hypothetical protein JNK47_14095 [Mesorhizobium sp.]|nr:hypothetical protein [Mesorhizobium sp.]MBL8578351.1 hypothetical protein [Mesorhizobium sp.]